MKSHVKIPLKDKTHTLPVTKNTTSPKAKFTIRDNRPEAIVQRKLQQASMPNTPIAQLTKCPHCDKNIKKCKCSESDEEVKLLSADEWWKSLSGSDRELILRKMGTHENQGGVNTTDKTTGGSKKGDSHSQSAGDATSIIFRIYRSDPEFFSLVKNWNDKNRVKKAKKI